ncbi:MAG: beta-galactosidase [Clostridia bacterium]|nr:beta-galactosidase [Clostridia bacterium]
MKKLTPKFPQLIHGADYNPEQWLSYPDILKKDIELLKKAHMNSVSVGIFSWAHLEPQEGVYDFDWLEEIINNLYDNGIYTVLATPSGAKPLWMSEKYEEVRRVSKDGVRDKSGDRHNHCYTSPYYRMKVKQMDTKLAERFSHHPGVVLWHLSNEFCGECYCPNCVNAFREWLKEKYQTLDNLNHAWWTHFWSHTYRSWDQINPPFSNGELSIHGLNLDWKRFVTHQTVDFMKVEMDAVKAVNPEIPCTANLMHFYDGLDYNKFDCLDVVSWDNYPQWHRGNNVDIAARSGACHDVMRSVKHQNFLLMENTPSTVNWVPASKLKRPGMHLAASLQAVAHGSESVQYFQFRKSRGSSEKFHGAVVDHVGTDETRVFRDVTEVGKTLEALTDKIYGSEVKAEVAVIYDWENRWAVENAQGPRYGSRSKSWDGKGDGIHYIETVLKHHRALWNKGINVDFVDMEDDISGYKLVIAPMLYMLRNNFGDKIKAFVEGGGKILMTANSGIVDDTDLCFLGGWPGAGLMEVFGIWNESIDGLWDEDENSMVMSENSPFDGSFRCSELCGIIHARGAEVLATYGSDFYEGEPCLTVNKFGQGKAYYLATQADGDFLDKFYDVLVSEAGVKRNLETELPYGVTVHTRTADDGTEFVFVENYSGEEKELMLPNEYLDILDGIRVKSIKLEPYQVKVLS